MARDSIRQLEWKWYDPEGIEIEKLIGLKKFYGARVLEVGSGIGVYTFEIAKVAKECVGIDIDPEVVRASNRTAEQLRVQNVRFLRMDAEKMDFEDQTFDAVVCLWTFNCVKDRARMLRECKRVLKVGGSFILLDSTQGSVHLELAHCLFPDLRRPRIDEQRYNKPLKRAFGGVEELGPFRIPYVFPSLKDATNVVLGELERWYTPKLSEPQRRYVACMLRQLLRDDGTVIVYEQVKLYVCRRS